ALYHAAKEEVPEEPETLPIGTAQVVREGRDLTLVTYGAMLRVAREAADVLQAEDGVETEVLDLLTIAPLDRETIVASVGKTGRAVVVHEAPRSFGPAAEIAASIMEGAFLHLEAPVRRPSAEVPRPAGADRQGRRGAGDVRRRGRQGGRCFARYYTRPQRPPCRPHHQRHTASAGSDRCRCHAGQRAGGGDAGDATA